MQALAAQVVLDGQPYQNQGYDYWEVIHSVSEPSHHLIILSSGKNIRLLIKAYFNLNIFVSFLTDEITYVFQIVLQ